MFILKILYQKHRTNQSCSSVSFSWLACCWPAVCPGSLQPISMRWSSWCDVAGERHLKIYTHEQPYKAIHVTYFPRELVETKTELKVSIGLDLCQVSKNMIQKENTHVALLLLDVCKGNCSQTFILTFYCSIMSMSYFQLLALFHVATQFMTAGLVHAQLTPLSLCFCLYRGMKRRKYKEPWHMTSKFPKHYHMSVISGIYLPLSRCLWS